MNCNTEFSGRSKRWLGDGQQAIARRVSEPGRSLLRGGAFFSIVAVASLLLTSGWLPLVQGDEQPAGDSVPNSVSSDSSADTPAHLIRVPLPIVGEVDTRVKAMIDELLVRWQDAEERPILILEFGGSEGEASRTSEFERALSLARYVAGERLNRVRTVAYLTGPVQGHAVLPVLACEEILTQADAELGRAGADEAFIDATIRGGYVEIAERRRTLPVPVVLAMLQGEKGVFKVQTQEGTRYVLKEELAELKKNAVVRSVEQIVADGEMANFTGSDLRLKLGFASHLIRNRVELASTLHLPVGSIEEDPTLGRDRRPVRVDVTGPIRPEVATWVERGLREKIEKERVNFIILNIDSAGGSPQDSVRLAVFLSELDASKIRTVAYVEAEARADAALIALACDQIVLTESAVLGGPGVRRIGAKKAAYLRDPIREIATAKHRDWSLQAAMIDSELNIRSWTLQGTGETRYFCDDELAEQEHPDRWEPGAELSTADGLRGDQAVAVGLARFTVADWDDLRGVYHLEGELESVQPNWANLLIEFIASPKVAGALLFIGWFALMIEFAAPGLSVSGFVSAICFVLYFWAHFLQGTAGWLEILLFATGVTCVALEIFVIPGFGAFGIGGGACIVASIILATQTFVIPRNAYEWSQVPSSLYMVIAAAFGAFASLLFMRRVLTEAPVFRRVALAAPDEEQLENIREQESLVHLDYLTGKRGMATTQLTPSGKARFGDDIVDVISEGEVVPRGSAVYVAAVRGNEVVVRIIE